MRLINDIKKLTMTYATMLIRIKLTKVNKCLIIIVIINNIIIFTNIIIIVIVAGSHF